MPVVSETAFIGELNRRLLLHPAYKPGMRFEVSPPSSSEQNAAGFTWFPNVPGSPQPFAAIAAGVIADGWETA